MHKNIFVFVVCGSKEHIDTLHFSLNALIKNTRNDIFILTDSKRNEVSIEHDAIIDVVTPENYNHHQASIFLKTGLHKFLPKGNTYCYLDTDVIALSSNCDLIFKEFIAPIRFAPDHCKVPKFSAYAVNCGCSNEWGQDRDLYQSAFDKQDKNKFIRDPELLQKAKELQLCFEKIKHSWPLKIKVAIQYFLSYSKFNLENQFYFDKNQRNWHLPTGEIVLYEANIKEIEKESGLKYSRWNQKWRNKNGDDIWRDECNHLVEKIGESFEIDVDEFNWQHWNGGVFLFNDLSHQFLDAWHEKSLYIFSREDWKTRDQGTLIATVWEFKLQNHPVLDKKWNFLADYNNSKLDFNADAYYTDDGWKSRYKVNFIHVYHHFGDENWNLWNLIQSV